MTESREEALFHLAALVARKTPLPRLYGSCHRILQRQVRAASFFVALVEGPDSLSFPYYEDERDKEDALALYPMEGLTASVILRGGRRWLAEEPWRPGDPELIGAPPSDWLGVPLIDRKGEVIGAIVAQDYRQGFRFRPADAFIMEFAALQLSLAIQLQAADRDIAVHKIATLIDDEIELEGLYAAIHAIAAELIPAASSSFLIARIDREAGLFRQVYCVDERERSGLWTWKLGTGLSGYVASLAGRSRIFEDGVTELPPGFEVLGERPAFWLGAPIMLGESMTGIVMIQTYDRAVPITREDERALNAICPHIATAIARADLLRHSHGM